MKPIYFLSNLMKRRIILALVMLFLINLSFFPLQKEKNDVMQNVYALLTTEKKLGMACTMGCQQVEYFYVCVMCGINPTAPCTIEFFDQGIGDNSTCGGSEE